MKGICFFIVVAFGAITGEMWGASAGTLQIVRQPANLTVTDGQPANFSVTARGNQPLTYQWMQGGAPVPGATNARLGVPTTIYTYHNATTYSVIVTDATGSQLTSQAATLTVDPRPPVITEMPLSQSVVPNSTANLAVAANGTIPLQYQWNRNGAQISGATGPSYETSPNTYAQNGDSYTVTVTNGAGQSVTSTPAMLTVQSGLAPTINVDCGENDREVAHQVTYRRGVVESFNLNRQPSTIIQNVTNDIQNAGIDSLNATLDIDTSNDTSLFNYAPPNLTVSTSGSQPLIETFQDLTTPWMRSASSRCTTVSSCPTSASTPAVWTWPQSVGQARNFPPGTLETTVQVSGMPEVYSDNADPGYEIVCNANGNYYPLPTPGTTMQEDQNAIESWISLLDSYFPGAIWIGTQEPSHTLGFSTSYNIGGCANVPHANMNSAISNNISRFIAYWTPIAQYLRANHIQSGGIQLNAGNNAFYATTATQIISAQMPLNYFTIQNYTPSAAVAQSLYSAYLEFQQNPNYLGVKAMIDRYGLALTGNTYGTAQGIINFLQDETLLMPYADMMYGYDVETKGIESTSPQTILPQVLRWLNAAPAPLRPLTSTTSDLQAFALVQKDSPQRAYIAIWNSSTSTSYAPSVALNGLNSSFTPSNLAILNGSGSSITVLNNSGITVKGDTISGLSLGPDDFLLITVL